MAPARRRPQGALPVTILGYPAQPPGAQTALAGGLKTDYGGGHAHVEGLGARRPWGC